MPSRNSSQPSCGAALRESERPLEQASGFAEASAGFDTVAADERRFTESVALMRTFNLIDTPGGRQQVLELARALAGLPRS